MGSGNPSTPRFPSARELQGAPITRLQRSQQKTRSLCAAEAAVSDVHVIRLIEIIRKPLQNAGLEKGRQFLLGRQ